MQSGNLARALAVLSLTFLTLIYVVPLSSAQLQEPYPNSVVRFPTLGSPAVTLAGGEITLSVSQEGSPEGWRVSIIGVKDEGGSLSPLSYELELLNVSKDDLWRVKVKLPEDVKGALYDLELSFTLDGKQLNYVQPNSVWVLDSFPEKLLIAQISDTQQFHVNVEKFVGGLIYPQLLGADLFIVTGDVSDVCADFEYRSIRELILRFVNIPMIIAPGNHDPCDLYDKYIGPRFFKTEIGRFLLVALDTGSFGFVSDDRLDWLEEVLRDSEASVKVLFFHHPIFGRDALGLVRSTYEDVGLELIYGSWADKENLARRFIKIVEDYNVTLVLSGHIHTDRIVRYESLRSNTVTWFVATTTVAAGRPNYNAFRLIELSASGEVSFPLMPPWGSIEKFPNSIPIDPDYKNHLSAKSVVGLDGNALTLKLENKLGYADVKGRFVVKVRGGYDVDDYDLYVDSFGTQGSAEIVGKVGLKGLVYSLVSINLPNGSSLRITVAPIIDDVPPSVEVAYTIPMKPRAGSPLTIFIQVSDEGWGVLEVFAEYEVEGKSVVLQAKFEVNFYKVQLPALKLGDKFDVVIKAVDAAGNVGTTSILVNVPKPVEEEEKPEEEVTPEEVPKEEEEVAEAPKEEVEERPAGIEGIEIVVVAAIIGIMVIGVAFYISRRSRQS